MQIGMIEKHMSIRPIIGLAGLACLLGCGRKPTLEECATAWRHALEVQIDEIDPVRMAEQFSALGKMNPEEKSLMWHMLECPGCFDRYVALKHPGAGPRQASADRDELAELARR